MPTKGHSFAYATETYRIKKQSPLACVSSLRVLDFIAKFSTYMLILTYLHAIANTLQIMIFMLKCANNEFLVNT